MTTDEAALLAAILASREDDLPRLVYADWLEERAAEVACPKGCRWEGPHPSVDYECPACDGNGRTGNGFAERADFIRVQCELARFDPSPAPNRYARWAHLRRRHRELLSAHVGGWFGPRWRAYPDSVAGQCRVNHEDGRQYDLARGFVHAITCPAAAWLEHGDSLYWRPGQTVECGIKCANAFGKVNAWCDRCKSTRRVPRHCPPPTAHPVEVVRLTDWPEFEHRLTSATGHQYRLAGRETWHDSARLAGLAPVDGTPVIARQLLVAEWPGVAFALPTGADWQATNSTPLGDVLLHRDRVLRDALRTGPPHLTGVPGGPTTCG